MRDDPVNRDYRFTTGNLCTRYLLDMLASSATPTKPIPSTRDTYPSFGFMIRNEATTVRERFELKKNPNMNSHNHPMYGAVGSRFYQYLAGITPTAPGFAEMTIKPVFPSALLSAHAVVDTVMGEVSVRWAKTLRETVPLCPAPLRLRRPPGLQRYPNDPARRLPRVRKKPVISPHSGHPAGKRRGLLKESPGPPELSSKLLLTEASTARFQPRRVAERLRTSRQQAGQAPCGTCYPCPGRGPSQTPKFLPRSPLSLAAGTALRKGLLSVLRRTAGSPAPGHLPPGSASAVSGSAQGGAGAPAPAKKLKSPPFPGGEDAQRGRGMGAEKVLIRLVNPATKTAAPLPPPKTQNNSRKGIQYGRIHETIPPLAGIRQLDGRREGRTPRHSDDDNELRLRFTHYLSFGTAGLRSVMKTGMNAMNTHTVAYATQARWQS